MDVRNGRATCFPGSGSIDPIALFYEEDGPVYEEMTRYCVFARGRMGALPHSRGSGRSRSGRGAVTDLGTCGFEITTRSVAAVPG